LQASPQEPRKHCPRSPPTLCGEPARVEGPPCVGRQQRLQRLHGCCGQRPRGRKGQRHALAAAVSQEQGDAVAHGVLRQNNGVQCKAMWVARFDEPLAMRTKRNPVVSITPTLPLPPLSLAARTCNPTTTGGASRASTSDCTSGIVSVARLGLGGGDASIIMSLPPSPPPSPPDSAACSPPERTSAAGIERRAGQAKVSTPCWPRMKWQR
jgi:hypothetical protein